MRIIQHYTKYGWSCKVAYKDETGKRRQRTEEFYQTISPFNNKTPEQIRAIEKEKAVKWAQGFEGAKITYSYI